MAGRIQRVTGMILVIAAALVAPILTTSAPASADTIVDGCTIVSNPTPGHFTGCPDADFSSADLAGVDLSYANLAGASFVDCFVEGMVNHCSGANLAGANLKDANLSGANFFTVGQLLTTVAVNVDGTNFSGADLAEADLDTFVDFSGDNLSGANLAGDTLGDTFVNANLSGANLTGASMAYSFSSTIGIPANLEGANLTGTLLIPSNQSVTATSQAGAVATWSTPPAIPGATPGSCTPASGSTFPLFSTTVTCQVLDHANDVATGTFQVNVAPTTQYFTRVLFPSNGAVLAGAPYLDAAAGDGPGVTKVVFEVSGGTLHNQVIATAIPTLFGWLAKWNTATVPNGAYTLESVATDAAHTTDTSTPITVTVNNQPPVTAVLFPAEGSTVSGATALLDASASSAVGIASVTFEVSGGTLSEHVVATATLTLFGWLAQWNTTGVPNGTYSLQSVATDTVAEVTASAPITVTVDNTPPSTSILIPSGGASLFGPAILDAAASDNVGVTKVEFHLTGGPFHDASIATATPTIYGWIADWNTKTVPSGTYTLQSVAYDAEGFSTHSLGITVTVLNGPIAYVTDFTNPASVVPINTENNTPGRPITGIGSAALALAISPDGTTAYLSNDAEPGTITPINLATDLAEAPITIGAKVLPGSIAITPDGSTAYVDDENTGAVIPVNLATKTVGTPIPACTTADDRPFDIVISPNGATAYVSCPIGGTVVPINTSTNTTGLPIVAGEGPGGLAITPNGATLYVANFGTFAVVNGVVEQFSDGDTVTPVDTAKDTAGIPITVGSEPSSVAIVPDGTTAYVTNQASNTVSPIDIATDSAGSPIAVNATLNGSPTGGQIAITPDGTTAYVITGNNTIVPIKTSNNTTETPISLGPFGPQPAAIAIH
jgi:YVTN family beta-propeller protein